MVTKSWFLADARISAPMLQQKTEGNRSPEESAELDSILHYWETYTVDTIHGGFFGIQVAFECAEAGHGAIGHSVNIETRGIWIVQNVKQNVDLTVQCIRHVTVQDRVGKTLARQAACPRPGLKK